MTASLLKRATDCVRERRLPYAVHRRLYSRGMLPVHRVILDPALSRKDIGPQPITLEAAEKLQSQYPCRDGYKYDIASKKIRAAKRLSHLGRVVGLDRPLRILELGGGDGQLSLMLSASGHSCTLIDSEDWRDEEVKVSTVRFIAADAAHGFPLDDASFDLCVSYNTMEHIDKPNVAFAEMARVLRASGTMFHSFSPLFNSPWGLHAYRHIHFPYPQFLLDESLIARFVDDGLSHAYGTESPSLVFVNGWSAKQFLTLFASRKDCLVRAAEVTHCLDHLSIVYRHGRAFAGRGLNTNELTTEGINICLSKV